MTEPLKIAGFKIFKEQLNAAEQAAMVADLRAVAQAAPMRRPVTRSGKQMSVQMTSAGRVGWISDRRGYRYEPFHPDGMAWPAIPARMLDLWQDLTGLERKPDCCLINFYGEEARMGLHQDNDEGDFTYPVVSVSLGDDGLFRMGGVERGGKTQSVWLSSGDVVVMGGDARLAYHGVDRIRFGSSSLLPDGGRINITLRVVQA
ncbi:alpha-ketoglutarate-dependent dioxygenase AlkB family protein [Shimia sagamensis]|uniref:Alkylated DNA repair protein (DNA oxidative demethylase) n=1 Tax=Shimia sagamensis TaxID=1566352 RepID=A0ABY1NB17_9RHOB|nr:alpha-ketoglutarate-dependent dioxygenase AlkB [Shimia sagamensis]SMP04979.1 alkylated DNA repair protein (DNA oxidative demethylase) [Shimia sagamensis]